MLIDLIEFSRLMAEIGFESYGNTQKPRILFLSHRFPYPPIGGDRVKAYHLLRHLSKIADVDVIALNEAKADAEIPTALKYLKSIQVVPFDKSMAALRMLGLLASTIPIEFAYYYQPKMQQAVDSALKKNSYDLIICFFLRTAEYVTGVSGIPKLLIAEDARVILQERASKRFEFSPQWIVRKIDAMKLRAYEPKIMAMGFDMVTFVAEEDRRRITSTNPRIPTEILTNGVDLKDFPRITTRRKNQIVFAGHLGVYHNRLMVERLIHRIFPRIRRASPETRLLIVGKDPPDSLTKFIENTIGVELHPNVPSVNPFIGDATAFVHPQEVGAGIQNKLLEAMAIGTAVVTTPIGANGIEGLASGVNALIGVSDEEIASLTISLLRDKYYASLLAENAYKLIETYYTWESVFNRLDLMVSQLTSGSHPGSTSEIHVPTSKSNIPTNG
jgi:glycosyltransferase involved in cell wall biosynthesis